jgi:O-antigen/teichoic acid export membrane protein
MVSRIISGLLAAARPTALIGRLRAFSGTSLYRNAIYIVLDDAAIAAAGFVFWILAARYYEEEDVGFATATLSAMSLLALVGSLGMDFGLIRFLPGAGDKSDDMVNSCLTIGGLLSVGAALIFIAGLSFWSPALIPVRQDPWYFAAFVVFTAGSTVSLLVWRTYVARRRAGFAVVKDIMHSVIKIAMLIPFAALQALGIFLASGVGLTVSLAVGLVVFMPMVQNHYRPAIRIRRDVMGEVIRFSIANFLSSLVWIAPYYVLPLFVVNRLGKEESAYFYVSWSVGSLLSAIAKGASSSLFAEGSHDERKLDQNIRRSLGLCFLLLAPASLLLFFFGDEVLLVFGHSYSDNGAQLLWLLTLSAWPQTINAIYFSIKRVELKMNHVMIPTVFIAVSVLAISYVLIPGMGIKGVGVAWLAVQCAVAVFTLAGLCKRLFRPR